MFINIFKKFIGKSIRSRCVFIGGLIAFIAVLSTIGVAFADYTCGGTLHQPPNTKTWSGYSAIHWTFSSPIIYYGGESYTEASSTASVLTVTSQGAETCGIFTMSPDWNIGPDSANNTWLIGRYGNGSVQAGTCVYYWNPHWLVGTHGYCAIWDNGAEPDDGSGQSESWWTEDWW